MDEAHNQREMNWARVAVLAGLLLAVALCSDTDPAILTFTWVPQGLLLMMMSFMRARPAAIAGAALALAMFLGFFDWWVYTYAANDGMAWLLYGLPGAFIAGIVAAVQLDVRDARPPMQAGVAAATWMIAGVAVNYLLWYVTIL